MFIVQAFARLFGLNQKPVQVPVSQAATVQPKDKTPKVVRQGSTYVVPAAKFQYSSVDGVWIAHIVKRELVAGTREKVIYNLLSNDQPKVGATLWFNAEQRESDLSNLKLSYQDFVANPSSVTKSHNAICVEIA